MNIAGVSAWGTVDQLTHQHWKSMIDVNLMGPIHVIETFIPPMVAAGRGGHLVNVSSAAGLVALPWHSAYSASKFGLRGLSEVLRFDLARHRIGVSVVVPGAVKTPLVQTVQIAGVDRDDPRVRRLDRPVQRTRGVAGDGRRQDPGTVCGATDFWSTPPPTSVRCTCSSARCGGPTASRCGGRTWCSPGRCGRRRKRVCLSAYPSPMAACQQATAGHFRLAEVLDQLEVAWRLRPESPAAQPNA